MKKTTAKPKPTSENLLEESKKMMKREGRKGWDFTKKTLLQQKTRNPHLKEALNYAVELPDYFRPAIISFCCKAAGGNTEVTIPCGASFVLLAKAIGMHDDIIDKLKVRNERPTLFGKFGKETTLITSDILMFKAFTLMRKNADLGVSQQTTTKILETIDKFWFEQGESEILELQARGKTDVTPQECLAKIKMRASELETIARAGGILGNGSEKEVEALANYGRLLGTASILRDELIDMLEPDVLHHRIKHESLPLPLIYALQNSNASSKITPIIFKKQLSNKDLRTISKITDNIGGISYVAERINNMVQEACTQIDIFSDKAPELKLIAKALIIHSAEWKSIV
jgi:geranylgeranyl pyrophosphate synthase